MNQVQTVSKASALKSDTTLNCSQPDIWRWDIRASLGSTMKKAESEHKVRCVKPGHQALLQVTQNPLESLVGALTLRRGKS